MKSLLPLLCLSVLHTFLIAQDSILKSAVGGLDWKKLGVSLAAEPEFQESIRKVFPALTPEKQKSVTKSIGLLKSGAGYERTETPVDSIVAKGMASKLLPLVVDDQAKAALEEIRDTGRADPLFLAIGISSQSAASEGQSQLSAPPASTSALTGLYVSTAGNGSGHICFIVAVDGTLRGYMYDGNPISGSVITGKRVGRKHTGTFVNPYNNATVEFTIASDRNDKLRMETVTRLKDGKKNETSFLTRVAKEDMAKALDETNNRKLSSDAKAVIDYFRAEGAK